MVRKNIQIALKGFRKSHSLRANQYLTIRSSHSTNIMQQASTDIFSFLENPNCLLCEASSATPVVLEPCGSALKAQPK